MLLNIESEENGLAGARPGAQASAVALMCTSSSLCALHTKQPAVPLQLTRRFPRRRGRRLSSDACSLPR